MTESLRTSPLSVLSKLELQTSTEYKRDPGGLILASTPPSTQSPHRGVLSGMKIRRSLAFRQLTNSIERTVTLYLEYQEATSLFHLRQADLELKGVKSVTRNKTCTQTISNSHQFRPFNFFHWWSSISCLIRNCRLQRLSLSCLYILCGIKINKLGSRKLGLRPIKVQILSKIHLNTASGEYLSGLS